MRFAIITDTHIRAPGGDLSSPFPVNEKANARAEYAVGLIAATAPEFTIHLGDVIHPLPHMPTAEPAAAEAKRILAPLKPNLHFVPGNHDIGDKPSKLMPAGPADAAAIEAYEKQLGPQYHSFTHGDAEIFCMNSSLVNTGTTAEQQQKDWLETALYQSRAQHKLIFSHYPPFILHAEEADHYDNYAEPGRQWLLTLAEKTGVSAIFSGHVHHFFYNRWRGIPLYCLPATSFTRQDYAELFPVSPADEFGRDDAGKFGISIVEIKDNKVNLSVINTGGQQGKYDKGSPSIAPPTQTIVNLRHAWHLPKALPYNGPMEEFSRKQARNDYPLLRLLQLGVQTLRVPGTDLLDPSARQRLEDWLALDKSITPFCTTEQATDVAAVCSALSLSGNAVKALELLISPNQCAEEIRECVDSVSASAEVNSTRIWLSSITSSADNPDPAKTFAHSVGYGNYINRLEKAVSLAGVTGAGGVVLQLPWESDLQTTVNTACEIIQSNNLTLVINLCLRPSNPAHCNFDDNAIAQRIETATTAVSQSDRIILQLDNFEDIDRGYGPRHGVIDRLSNLRPAFSAGLSFLPAADA